MTPAIELLKKAKVPFTVYEYEHDPESVSFGMEAAQKLGVEARRVLKTLVVRASDGEHAVCIIPVDRQLDLKLAAKALGAKKVELAPAADAERVTGFLVGGVSPFAQKRRLRTVIEEAVSEDEEVLVSAGRRGMDLGVSPQDLARTTDAGFAGLVRDI